MVVAALIDTRLLWSYFHTASRAAHAQSPEPEPTS